MAVYTHFGAMSELMREMVHEGFARLQRHLTVVRETGDPVADMALLGRAYRHNALTNPHLYAVMFGGSSPGGFSLTENDRQHGRYTLGNVVGCAARCIDAGRFRATDAELVAHQMWTATHGVITLELGGYLIAPYDADRCFEAQLAGLMVGAGDAHDAAIASVRASMRRFEAEVASRTGGGGRQPWNLRPGDTSGGAAARGGGMTGRGRAHSGTLPCLRCGDGKRFGAASPDPGRPWNGSAPDR